ncbi:MAG TPA: acetyl-CoA carboxylase biotin carboxyl carrier protein subunit [Stellaceae bacterium]|nr:acetyl-CoA carboxylase biotin carboxyl carrier protein subunit [Stellaceae bacterium]
MRIGGKKPPLTPDPELVRTLAALLQETGLSEIEYAVGDCRIRVARNTAAPPVSAPPPAAETAKLDGAARPLAVEETPSAGVVTAPMVGTAYLAPQQGAPLFVKLGDEIAEGQVLLIIEAMKVMNQIRAPRPGHVRRILVEDGAPVEYGAALMLIE